jgi:hypothetical protein
MDTKEQAQWATRVGLIFNTSPRIGIDRNGLWHSRGPVEEEFARAVERPSNHVCLDGPSGSGKSSLALTYFEHAQIPYAYVPVTTHMTWSQFCKEVLLEPESSEHSVNTELELGIQHALPIVKFRISFGSKSNDISDLDKLQRLCNLWSEHDVAREMIRHNAAVVIDDLERASEELLTRLSDLAKILIRAQSSPRAKLLFIGTGDVYRRLILQNESLKKRLEDVSLGAFPEQGQSWRFLTAGLDRLNLLHPGTSRYEEQRKQVDECARAVYHAADGLPKSLNHLGQEIALEAKGRRKGISANDIISTAQRVLEQNWEDTRYNHPTWLATAGTSNAVFSVVTFLFKRGIGRIHHIRTIVEECDSTLAPDMVEHAIEELEMIGFLVTSVRS